MYNSKKRLSRGQSFLEVVMALALISIILITLVSLSALSIRSSVFARNQTEASRFTQQVAEWLRAEKDANWSTFYSHAGTASYCLDQLYWTKTGACSANSVISGTVFKRLVTFTLPADGSVQARIQTSWTDSQGIHSVPTSVVFTNWK